MLTGLIFELHMYLCVLEWANFDDRIAIFLDKLHRLEALDQLYLDESCQPSCVSF